MKASQKKEPEKPEVVLPEFYKTTVDLSRDKVERFKQQLPGVSLKWFIDACLDSFLARHVGTTEADISKSVDSAVERVREGGMGI